MARIMSKKSLNETEICDQYITPAIHGAGWDKHTQVRREFFFTDGQVLVRGKVAVRGKRKRADYLLFHSANFPLAVVEAKDNNHPVGGGMQQAIRYAEALDVGSSTRSACPIARAARTPCGGKARNGLKARAARHGRAALG